VRTQDLHTIRLRVGMICAMLAATLLLPRSVGAHPHVFIYTATDIVFDEKGLAGFRIRWLFDEMFSSMIILDYDQNGDHRFDSEEIEQVRQNAFSHVKNFDYFTHVKIDGRVFKVQYVTDFTARIHNDKMIYEFFVPCHVPATDIDKEVKLAIYDETFYTSVFLVERPVAFENADAFEVEHHIAKNRDEAYYFGQIFPEEITFRFRLRPPGKTE